MRLCFRHFALLTLFTELSAASLQPVIHPYKPDFNVPSDVGNHPNLRLLSKNCGKLPQQKNFLGYSTSIFDFPWAVLLQYDTTSSDNCDFKCAGSLINEKYVLTAAHCISNLPTGVSLSSVLIGVHNTNYDVDCEVVLPNKTRSCAPTHQKIAISDIIIHPNYNNNSLEYDIGLIRLSVSFDITKDNAGTICLPINAKMKNLNLEGYPAIVVGYEQEKCSNYTNIESFTKTYFPVLMTLRCNDIYVKSNHEIQKSQVCAGGKDGADWCVQISSGLFVLFEDSNRRYVQYGVPSATPAICNVSGQPRIYSRVIFFMNWVLDTIKY